MRNRNNKKHGQSGFTLIEAMMSILILSVGLLSAAVIYAQGIQYASTTQFDYIAQKKAEQTVEAIFAARDTGALSWATIQNQSSDPKGVFMDGPQPMLQPGPDGLVGTVSDSGSPHELVTIGPNASGQLGTSSDQTVDLNPWMTRTIAITSVTNETNLRQITVTINYKVGKAPARSYTLVTNISAFS